MSLVLIVEDMPICRDPIAAAIRMLGYNVATAADGAQALEQVAATPPDLILLDLGMPVMDGITCLKHLRERAETAMIPVILLTALSDRQVVIEAGRFGVKDYLLKSQFSLKELQARIAKYLSPSTPASGPIPTTSSGPAASDTPEAQTSAPTPCDIHDASHPAVVRAPNAGPRPLTRADSIARAEKCQQGKVLSGIIAHVISLASSQRTDMTQLAETISQDPILSARVLAIANSAAYVTSHGVVTTVSEAVRNIGCNAIRNMAASVVVYDAMSAAASNTFDPIRCWQHSFAVASLCQQLISGRADSEQEADLAYLVGLCHDLGETLFHTHFGEEYRYIVAQQAKTGRPREELEREHLGITHAELVTIILQHLGLPDAIRRPIEQVYAQTASLPSGLARVLRVANSYASACLLATSATDQVSILTQPDARHALGTANPDLPDPTCFRNEIFGKTALLARFSSEQESRLMTPLLSQRDIHVYLYRDPLLSSIDPVTTSLQQLARCTLAEELPAAIQFTGHKLLVLVTHSADAPADPLTVARAWEKLGKPPVFWLTTKIQEGVVPPTAPIKPMRCPISLAMLDQALRRASGT